MTELYALCDYNGHFGSKYFAKPYRSGMDKALLEKAFEKYGVRVYYQQFVECTLSTISTGHKIIYTSQEDAMYKYKSYIEDVVYGLELAGAHVIPEYKYLRANNNKVMMEFIRQLMLGDSYQLKSIALGTLEEVEIVVKQIKYPCVIKSAEGAGSRGVMLAKNKEDMYRTISKLSITRNVKEDIHDLIRSLKHKGYQRESLHRNKYIIQEFIPGLTNDWKVLVYHDKYYVLRRNNRPQDFRASGSGLFSFDDEVDPILLNAAKEIKEQFRVPMISIDLAINNGEVILIEFQFVFFGVSTIEKSPYYYQCTALGWQQFHTRSVLEDVYAYAISSYVIQID